MVKEKNKTEFKVGDKVRVKDDRIFTGIKNGDIGHIIGITDTMFKVLFNDVTQYVPTRTTELYIELVKQDKNAKQNDKTFTVKVIDESGNVVADIKTRCIIASVDDANDNSTHQILLTNKCSPLILAATAIGATELIEKAEEELKDLGV